MNTGLMRYCSILPALLLLAACSQEEPTDSSRLPDGAYPMVFTAGICEPEQQSHVSEMQSTVSETQSSVSEPQSRVVENYDGKCFWVNGDKIKVKVTNGVREMKTTCTLDGSGVVTQCDPQLYWCSNEDAGVSAWYSNITGQSTVNDNTVDLSDQSRGPAYVLRATATTGYASPIQLNFTHQLAKIIVRIEGEGALCVSSVKIHNYTSCTITDGEVIPKGTHGSITMFEKNGCFEAGVVPISTIPTYFITVNDAPQMLKGITNLEAGKVYTITINAEFPVKKTINGHKAVLMRKASAYHPALYFATCNISASSQDTVPEDTGLYFWWGDVVGYTSGFEFSKGNTKIVTDDKDIDNLKANGYIDDHNNLTPDMDAAREHWGGSWRMPTLEDMQWLLNPSNCTWTANSNPAGYYVESISTGGKIFLPAAGYRFGTNPYESGNGFYWTSTADKDTPADGNYLFFNPSLNPGDNAFDLPPYYGMQVRPVSN